MAFTIINGTDYIGNSRTTINTNNSNFDTAISQLTSYNNNPLFTTITSLCNQVYGPTSRFYTVIFSEQQGSNINGGSFSSGAWNTRTLNTTTSASGYNFTGQGSLASNQFTLPAGTWLIRAEVPGYNLFNHQARLFNVTSSTVVAYGTCVYNRGTAGGTNNSIIVYSINIPSGTVTYRIEHRGANSQTNTGLGIACGFGAPEVYTKVICTEIAS